MIVTLAYMGTRVRLDVTAIGIRAAARREQLHLDQEQVAEKAGMSRAYVSRLENGAVPNPKVSDLASVADALGLTLDLLIYGRVGDAPDADITNMLMRHFGPQVGSVLVRLDLILAQMESDDEHALTVLLRNTVRKYDSERA